MASRHSDFINGDCLHDLKLLRRHLLPKNDWKVQGLEKFSFCGFIEYSYTKYTLKVKKKKKNQTRVSLHMFSISFLYITRSVTFPCKTGPSLSDWRCQFSHQTPRIESVHYDDCSWGEQIWARLTTNRCSWR